METVLLDTNIVSIAFKSDSRFESYAPHLRGRHLAVSFMTVAELYQWTVVRNWGNRRIAQLERTLRSYIFLPVSVELCRLWGQIRGARRSAGRPISPQDAWIAATALHHGIPLVTDDDGDFAGIQGLEVRTASVTATPATAPRRRPRGS